MAEWLLFDMLRRKKYNEENVVHKNECDFMIKYARE